MTPWPTRADQRERKTDSEIARARNIEPWMLRRERYLVATGRVRELVAEEQAAARERERRDS
jgi:hypothetical protein